VEQDEDAQLRKQIRDDLKLIKRAEQALAEIDRGPGISNEQAEVLVALRFRIEGKERAKLEDLLSAAGDISGKKGLEEVLDSGPPSTSEWPVLEEKKREWPGS
jgi:hypothetical protein